MKYLTIILLLIMFFSCKMKSKESEKKNGNEVIDVINFNNSLVANLSDLCDSMTLIPFKTKSPIGNIEKLIFHDENIYIWDKNRERIWGFKNNGDSLFCIDKQGKGAGEYIRIGDVSISDFGHINIVDTGSKRILCYNSKGELQSSQKFNRWIHQYCSIDGYQYLFCATPPTPKGNYVDVMEGSKIINSYFPSTHNWHFDGTEFLRSGDSLFFTRRYDDCIYSFKNGVLNEAYNINFGNDAFYTRKLREASTLQEHKNILKSRSYIGDIGNLSVTDTHITFDYSEPLDYMIVRTHFFFNRETKIGLSFKSYGDSNKKYFSMGTPIGSDGHYFYALIEPWKLDEQSKMKLQELTNYPLGTNLNCLLCRFLIKI